MTDSPNAGKKPQLQTSQQSFQKSPNASPSAKGESPMRRDTHISLKQMPSNLDMNESGKIQFNQSDFTKRIDKHNKDIENGEGFQNYQKAKNDLDEVIKDLDVKLNRVLAKQEYEYLKGYNVYVRQKEKELKTTIQQLSERYSNQGAKEKKVQALQLAIKSIREEQIYIDRENLGLKDNIKKLKITVSEVNSEKDFFEQKVKETKKKNQLLKLAILRLQNEVDTLKNAEKIKAQQDYEHEKSQFFITELTGKKASPRMININATTMSTEEDYGKNTARGSMEDYVNDPLSQSVLGVKKKPLTRTLQAHTTNGASHKRVRSVVGSVSRYAHIPTDNQKFRHFIDALFSSKRLTQDDIQNEVKSYVEVLETNYTDTIREQKAQIDRLQKKLRLQKGEKTNQTIEKTEMEAIFVECIEDVRKEILKRRLKNEMATRKKEGKLNLSLPQEDEQASKEFEESLTKLAAFAKGRIKYEDFTQKDKFNILDLFVNNQKTLIKIYEALFPHRVNNRSPSGSGVTAMASPSNEKISGTTGRYGYISGVDSSTQAATRAHLSAYYATPNKSGTITPSIGQNPSGGMMSLNLTLNKNLHTNLGGYGSSLYQKPGNTLQVKSPMIASSGLGNYSEQVTIPNTNANLSSLGAQSIEQHSSEPQSRINQESGFMLPSIVNTLGGNHMTTNNISHIQNSHAYAQSAMR